MSPDIRSDRARCILPGSKEMGLSSVITVLAQLSA